MLSLRSTSGLGYFGASRNASALIAYTSINQLLLLVSIVGQLKPVTLHM